MKKLLVAFVLGIACAAGAFGALHYHVILTSDGLFVAGKSETTFTDTFVDTREWGPLDYLKHRSVSSALARRGLDDVLGAASDAKDKAAEDSKELLERSRKAVGEALQKAGEKLQK